MKSDKQSKAQKRANARNTFLDKSMVIIYVLL